MTNPHVAPPAQAGDHIVEQSRFYRKFISPFFTGFWLLALYFFCTTMVVFSLTAHQLNNEITEYSAAKPENQSLSQIKNTYNRWRQKQDSLDVINANIQTLTQTQNASIAEQTTLGAKSTVTKAEFEYLAGDIANDLATPKAPSKAILFLLLAETPIETPHLTRNDLLALSTFNAIVAAKLLDLDGLAKTQRLTNARLNALDAQIPQLGISIEAQKNKRTSLDCEIQITLSNTPNASDCSTAKTDADISNFLQSMSFFRANSASAETERRRFPFNILGSIRNILDFSILISMPAEMLTIIVVISMGALGGTIHLTQIFLKGRIDKSPDARHLGLWYFLFRPMLGCIVAIAIYILARAGILVVATPTEQGAGANLSPYFISFLGIISGLIAQNAIETMQLAGRQWFKNANTYGPDRWAHGLNAALKDKDGDFKDKLAAHLGVTKPIVDDWAAEKRQVPYSSQTALAGYFQTPVREMLSDLRDGDMMVEPPQSS